MRLTYLLPCLGLAFAAAGAPAWATSGHASVDVGDQHVSNAYADFHPPENTGQASSSFVDDTRPGIRASASATSSAILPGSLGYVSLDIAASRSGSGSSKAGGWASWMTDFVNETGAASEFVITVSTDFEQSTGFIDPLVPEGWVLSGPSSPPPVWLPTSLNLNIGYGAGTDLKPSGPGSHSFSLGVLQPGESIFLSLNATGSVDINVYDQLFCAPGATDLSTCVNLAQSASGSYRATVSVLSIAAVPEPTTCLLTGMGLLAATLIARRRSP